MHLAADNFSGAIDEFVAALRGMGPEAPGERVRLLCRLAEALTRRGENEAALAWLRERFRQDGIGVCIWVSSPVWASFALSMRPGRYVASRRPFTI